MLEMLLILMLILPKLLLYCIPFIVLFIMPFVIAVVAIIKNKTKLLKVTGSVATVVSGIVVIFCILFPTAFPYVDWWIYGKTQQEVRQMNEEVWYDWAETLYQRAPHSIQGYYYVEFTDYTEDGKACGMGTTDALP